MTETTKWCARCDTTKSASEFYTNCAAKDGLQTYCKPCLKAYELERYHKNPARRLKIQRKSDLKRKYGLTQEAYDSMISDQNGMCAICLEKPEKFCVDHDHSCCEGEKSCGKCIRQLLCPSCNLALGNMRDDPQRLRAAADYLERWV